MIKFRLIFVLFVIQLAFNSCKKQKFTGESEYLIGEWIWDYSGCQYSNGNTYSVTDSTDKNLYMIKFEKKAIATFYENGVEIVKVKLHLINKKEDSKGFYFEIKKVISGNQIIFSEINPSYNRLSIGFSSVDNWMRIDDFPYQTGSQSGYKKAPVYLCLNNIFRKVQ